jgi:hypothetical protein
MPKVLFIVIQYILYQWIGSANLIIEKENEEKKGIITTKQASEKKKAHVVLCYYD